MQNTIRVIGLDVSQDTFDAAYFKDDCAMDKDFPNSLRGFKSLLKWVKAKGIELRFCMEATGAYSIDLAEFLHAQGYTVYVENARLIKAFRESENERNTTDKQSARIIARYAMSKLKRLRAWQPLPAHIKSLRELTRFRDALLQSKMQWNNRLKSRAIQELKPHVLQMLEQIKSSIKEIDRQIRRLISITPELKQSIKLLTSIKGIGIQTASVILSEVPWIHLFEDKRDLVAFAGLNPALRKSGTSIDYKPMLSKKGSPRLRKALYMPAVVAIKHNKRIAHFSSRLRKRGKHSMAIVGAAMAKLLCFVFGVLKSGEPFRAERDALQRFNTQSTATAELTVCKAA